MASKKRAGFTLVELMVVILIIGLLIAILLPAISRAYETARTVDCASKLNNIYKALLTYTNADESASLPKTKRAAGNTWRHIGYKATTVLSDTGDECRGNTRALYTHLVRGSYLPAENFICPSAAHQTDKRNLADPATYYDFPDHGQISYSYQNNWTASPKLTKESSFPLMADRNPQFKFVTVAAADGGGERAVDNTTLDKAKLCTDPNRSIKESANSANHGGRGQNVLFAAGNVRWCSSPKVGPTIGGIVDNIYTRHDGSEWGKTPGADSDALWTSGTGHDQDGWLVP